MADRDFLAWPFLEHRHRALCLARDILARHSGLADFAFAMQGLGTGAITLHGSDALRARVLPELRAGRSLAAFWVPGDAPGLSVAERIVTAAPHPLARRTLEGVRVPDAHRIGAPGEGFKVAMATLDVFRATVGAAALGFARRGLELLVARASARRLFGAALVDQQPTQAAIADCATEVDADALLVYRAAWLKDQGAPRVSREAAMAKLYATEAAGRVADRAAQLHGGLGVVQGSAPELLTREVRALRVYEGASEIQRIVIARAERDRAA